MEKLISKDPELEIMKERVRVRIRRFKTIVGFIQLTQRAGGAKTYPPVGTPYKMTGKEYKIGKMWCGRIMDSEEITVVNILHVPVDTKVIAKYVDHIVRRLNNAKASVAPLDTDTIIYLEEVRHSLHSDILGSAGFSPMEISTEAMIFKSAVEDHVEKEVVKSLGSNWSWH